MKSSLAVLVSVLILGTSCDKSDQPKTEKESDVLFYAETEADHRLFDVKTGKLNKDVTPTILNTEPMRTFHGSTYSQKTFADFKDDAYSWFIVDGNYAVDFAGKRQFDTLSLADTYAKITGTLRANSLFVGLSAMRFFIHPTRLAQEVTASMKVDGAAITSILLMRNGFLTVAKTGQFLISQNWQHEVPASFGLTVQSTLSEVVKSTINTPQFIIEKAGAFRIKASSISSPGVAIDGCLENSGTINIYGNLNVTPVGYLIFHESTDFKPVPNQVRYRPVGISLAELSVSETALVDGKISIDASWSPADKEKSLNEYKKFFATNNEFTVVKARKLLGRARFATQREAQSENSHLQKWHSYFEEFVSSDNKKLALEHDYLRGLLKIKIVDKSVATDKDGCLPDIGAFDRAEYNRFKTGVN